MGAQAFPDAPRINGFHASAEELVIVGLDTPHTSRAEHWLWDERAFSVLDQLDIENVAMLGITTDVTYKRINKVAYVVDGRHRVRWVREANKIRKQRGEPMLRVPCREATGDEMQIWLKSRAANAVRAKPSPIAIAREIQQLLGTGVDEQIVATTYAKTVAQVRESQDLLTLSPKAQALVHSEALKATAAKLLVGKTFEEMDAEIDAAIASGEKLTVERVRAATRNGARNGHARSETVGLKLKQIHALFGIAKDHLGPREIKLLGILCGKNKPREIAGMTEALRELGFDLDD
mgnify:CR=1 FL=1